METYSSYGQLITSSTRAQMLSKQSSQSLVSRNSERPYVIGNKHHYLTSKLYKHVADHPGTILYRNKEIMLVIFKPDNGEEFVETFKISRFMPTADKFTVEIHYVKDIGDFDAGDLLFEYNSYREGVYAAGYNINTAYMNFFGMTFEDSVVLSESAAKKMITQKMEKIIIPIYSYTLLKADNYPNSKYGFIPDIGQHIDGKKVYAFYSTKDNTNKENLLTTLSLEGLVELLNDDYQYNIKHKFCKLENAVVHDIKIHKFKNSKTVVDPTFKRNLDKLYDNHSIRCRKIYKDLVNIVGIDYAKYIMASEYIMVNHKRNISISIEDLLYMVEVDIVKEYPVKVGDKLSNTYANKGVVSAIIPDDLMPIIASTGERIDSIVGSLSVKYAEFKFC